MSIQPTPDPIAQAADALLQIVVKGARERLTPEVIKAKPFVWRDPTTIPTRDALDLSGLATDPIGTACRAELRRIGHALHAADPDRDMADLALELAELDPTHTDWRAIVLETAWAGIGGTA